MTHVIDDVQNDDYFEDISTQGANNYNYDNIGNLIRDTQEGLNAINWSVYGKIASIVKVNGVINYAYDGAGNRVYSQFQRGSASDSTWYVRDAQGNTLAVYGYSFGRVYWKEQHLYGSSRLGIWQPAIPKDVNMSSEVWNQIGKKRYELTNHLGNVLATISDKPVPTNGYYTAELISAQDYYPFGMIQPGRSYLSNTSTSYRYGFNGKENDNDVKGEGRQQDYGMRVYDPRVGRFLSVDPLTSSYPFYSPYQFASNSPLIAIDVDGLESSRILNKAESLLFTPYEFGGKKPTESMIVSIRTAEGEQFWVDQLKPVLQNISDNHPTHYKSKHNGSTLTNSEINSNWSKIVKDAYAQFKDILDNGKSLGIDCSGFVFASYTEDKELLLESRKLNTGSGGQLGVFKDNTGWGKAYYHKNFNLISAGDLVHNEGHVMIATGNVRLNEKGAVTAFQTYEANSTDKGSITLWRDVKAKYTIGHPFRTTDNVSKPVTFGTIQTLSPQSYGLQRSFINLGLQRIKDNLKQTVEKPSATN